MQKLCAARRARLIFASLARRAAACLRERGAEALWREASFRISLMTKGEVWRFRADIPLRRELKAQRAARFARMPLVSVVVPLYNTPPKFFARNDAERAGPDLRRPGAGAGGRIRRGPRRGGKGCACRAGRARALYPPCQNGGIAENTNAALAAAQGEYIALLDHDDVLTPNALYEAVKAVNEQGADFVYSDEIVLDSTLKKLGEYHFKPDFSPDTLRGCNYITHLAVFSRALLAAAGGGERAEFDGAQDFDLILRLTERAQKVAHVPKVLYWWRGHGGSTASGMQAKPYALAAGAAAVEAQLLRLGMPGRVEPIPGSPGAYRTRYDVTRPGRVTVLIPNKDHSEDLARCLESLYRNAGWDDLEVLVLENKRTLGKWLIHSAYADFRAIHGHKESIPVLSMPSGKSGARFDRQQVGVVKGAYSPNEDWTFSVDYVLSHGLS